MNLLEISKFIQLLIAITLTFLVLIQTKGMGLSSAFSSVGGFYRTRRGVEKFIFIFTLILGILFVANSILIVFLS